MPELPDLQVIGQNLDEIYSNRRLLDIFLAEKAKTNMTSVDYKQLLVGQKVLKIRRIGKEIEIEFENNHNLVLHLMREGKFFKTDEGIKNIILKLEFEGNNILIMNDFMGQARVLLDPENSNVPDPFSKQFTEDYLRQKLGQKKRTTIKSFLINQEMVLGIGNAYADEILWETRLSPATKCGDIPDEIIKVLYKNIISVLQHFIIIPVCVTSSFTSFIPRYIFIVLSSSQAARIILASIIKSSIYWEYTQNTSSSESK